MGNAVFPSLPGLAWDVTRTPVWSTTERKSAAGRAFRSANYSYPLYRVKLAFDVLRQSGALAEMAQLAGFYNSVGGAFDSFLWIDPDDNAVVAQAIGTGNGSATQWQLIRAFGGFVEPVFDVAGAPTILIDGVPVNLLAPYGGFESDTNADGKADGITAYSYGTVSGAAYSRVGGNGSAYSQRATAGSIGSSSADQVGWGWANPIPVVAGQQYAFGADLLSSASTTVNIEVHFYTSGSSYISKIKGSWAGNYAGYDRHEVTGAAPANAALAWCYIYLSNCSAATPELYADNAVFRVGASAAGFSDRSASVSATGLVTVAPAPAIASVVAWTGSYYRRMRFVPDTAEFVKFMSGLWSLKSLEMESVKP